MVAQTVFRDLGVELQLIGVDDPADFVHQVNIAFQVLAMTLGRVPSREELVGDLAEYLGPEEAAILDRHYDTIGDLSDAYFPPGVDDVIGIPYMEVWLDDLRHVFDSDPSRDNLAHVATTRQQSRPRSPRRRRPRRTAGTGTSDSDGEPPGGPWPPVPDELVVRILPILRDLRRRRLEDESSQR